MSLARSLIVTSLMASALLLMACGGGSSGGGSASSTATDSPAAFSGQFIDSAVSGLGYRCDGGSLKLTDASGGFLCGNARAVQFQVGDVILGGSLPQITSSVITPRDVLGQSSVTDPAVINMVRFLMTLDSDGIPENGLQIDSQTSQRALGSSIDFHAADFGSRYASLITTIAQRPLVSGTDAQQHILQSSYALNGGLYQLAISALDENGLVWLSRDGSGLLVTAKHGATSITTNNFTPEGSLLITTEGLMLNVKASDGQLQGSWATADAQGSVTIPRIQAFATLLIAPLTVQDFFITQSNTAGVYYEANLDATGNASDVARFWVSPQGIQGNVSYHGTCCYALNGAITDSNVSAEATTVRYTALASNGMIIEGSLRKSSNGITGINGSWSIGAGEAGVSGATTVAVIPAQ